MFQKLLLDVAVKQIGKKFKLEKLMDYVEKPNDADDRIDKLELQVHKLERLSHQPQEFICCKKCGCKINKIKQNKRRK